MILIVQGTADWKGRIVMVSSSWWGGFKKWHSELSLCITEQLANNRASACTPDILSNYFEVLKQTIQENNLKPHPIVQLWWNWNATRSKPPKSVTAKGTVSNIHRKKNRLQPLHHVTPDIVCHPVNIWPKVSEKRDG